MWFNIVGTTLGFIGSIIFSAGLIKPSQQIRDENAAYWDANPYTLDSELRSQPYYIAAFIFIIIGFAIALGGMLGEVLDKGNILTGVLLSALISVIGCLGTAIFFIRRINAHQKKKGEVAIEIFKKAGRGYAIKMHEFEGKANAQLLFDGAKSVFLNDLKEKARKIPEYDNELESTLIMELNSADSPQLFYAAIERYLNDRM